MKFRLPPPPTPTVREENARRATEALLAAALLASLLACLTRGPDPPRQGPRDPPLRDLPIDVAHDPPWLLRLLPGMGPARVQAVVADREKNGPLPSLDRLRRIRGFGDKTIATLAKAGATVTPAPPDPREHSPP